MSRGPGQLLTRTLLSCGVVAGPMFLLVVAIQDLVRTDLDPTRHPLSLLSLGELGYIQVTNFVAAGALNLAFAAGLWRTRRAGRRAEPVPLLIAGYGAGLIIAGLFVRDPAPDYPPGATEPDDPTWHATLHGVGAIMVFASLIVGSILLSRRFAREADRAWAIYSGVTGVLLFALLALTSIEGFESALLRVAAVVGWSWSSVMAARALAMDWRSGHTSDQSR